jgi:methionyl-tRNA formyltransferase
VAPGLANRLAEGVRGLGHEVVALMTARNQRNPDAVVELVADPPSGLDVLLPHSRLSVGGLLAAYDLDLAICSGFNWLLPEEAIAAPRLGILNGHPSLLPRWRGPNPFGWTLRAGEPELGFTWHLMDAELDTGPVLAQGSTPLDDDDARDTLFEKMGPLTGGLLAHALERLEAGDRGDPQPTEGATWAPLFEEEFTEIDWTRPAREIHNQVRSWFLPTRSGVSGAHTTLDGRRVKVTRSQLVTGEFPPAAPGTIVAHEDGTLLVQCGDGPLRVLTSEPV